MGTCDRRHASATNSKAFEHPGPDRRESLKKGGATSCNDPIFGQEISGNGLKLTGFSLRRQQFSTDPLSKTYISLKTIVEASLHIHSAYAYVDIIRMVCSVTVRQWPINSSGGPRVVPCAFLFLPPAILLSCASTTWHYLM